jgi:hypothetical protein
MTGIALTSIPDDNLRAVAMQLANKGYLVDIPEHKKNTQDAIYIYPRGATTMMFAVHGGVISGHLRVYFYPDDDPHSEGLSMLIRADNTVYSVLKLAYLARRPK